ncbi:FAD-binding oxidoreductase [Brachybacterium sp. YJGR34]|uniref:FAD-binding oxidoreductase n=1 Tax=Brachybacterium sp. YJGR34 TaxID=2059911 RepID=UPI000E0C2356|nr:FAD-binding oxidoreductase [Brachybacterium sp. YJGR34]
MSLRPHSLVDQLRTAVRGPVHAPGDPGFAVVHRPWNLAVAQDVPAVVEARDAEDVRAVLTLAARHRVPVAAQPTGHGASGRAAGAILLRTGRLDEITIDPHRRVARIGAGVLSGALQRAAAVHGLTGLPGSSPVVSVAGVVLGGGLSWFGRALGWAADSLLAAEVVTADGALRRVDPDSDPELLWALRGGGGDLAVLTALELRLHPAPAVVGGRMLWPAEHAREVAAAFEEITAAAPDQLTTWFSLLTPPGGAPLVALDAAYLGQEAEARELLAPADLLPAPLSDTRAPMSTAEMGTITGEPTDPTPGASRAELLGGVDAAALEALLAAPIAPLLTAQIRHLGGAFAHPSDSPHGPLLEPFVLYAFGLAPTPEAQEAVVRRQAELVAPLPLTGRAPLVFLDPSKRIEDALPPRSVARLRALKEHWDPADRVRGNVAISG